MEYYPADATNLLLKSASETFHSLRSEYEKLAAENTSLKAMLSQERVELQKVASARGLSDDVKNQLVDMLVDRSIIQYGDREKFAAACTNPETAVKVAMQAIRKSAAAVSQGSGVSGYNISKEDQELEEEKRAWQIAATAYNL